MAGVRVIDFGHYLAGPLAAMLLADQGAEVLKIIQPGRAEADPPFDAVLNRRKRRLSLDLKTESGRTSALTLIDSADVVIENFRPGVMERLGLGAKAATARHPRLIYLSLPGFASDDSTNSQVPAWEGVIGSACGLYTDVNLLRNFLGLPPVYSALPYGSVYGGVHGALAVLMALIARETTGTGEIIEVPLVSAAMSAMGSNVLNVARQPKRYDLPAIPRVVRWALMPALKRILKHASPDWQERAYQLARAMVPALMESYVCADDRVLHVFATDHRRHARDLLQRLGLLGSMEGFGIRDRDLYAPGGGRCNLAEGSNWPQRWQRQFRARIAQRLRTRPAEVWESELAMSGVPCTIQRTTADWLSLEPLHAARIVVDADDPEYGRIRQAGLHCWLREDTNSLSASYAARKSGAEDSESLPGSQGKAHNHLIKHSATEKTSALDGVKVLDLSTMVAGPVCARTLAEYGAEVIKIVSPHPLHGPRMVCWFGIEVDQGKRSLILDLKTKEGQEVLRRLIERADVLVHNFSRAVAAKLGLRKEDLARINPRLLLCRVGAYEGPNSGPWEERKAYDPVLQAASGIMVRYGSREQPEYHGLASCIDYVTGYCAALGAALAIYRRTHDPRGTAAEAVTSLAAGAQLAQVAFAFDFPGRIWDEPSGQHCRGDHALHRLYRARDGWFFLAARVDKRDAILAKAERSCPPGLASAGDSKLAMFLEACFRRHSIAHWQRVFAPLDVAVFPVRTLREIRRACVTPRPAARYLAGGPSVQVVRQRHPAGCLVDTLAPAYARLSRHPLRYLEPAPKPGSDSLKILEELGVSDDKQQELVDKGVVALELSKEYLPP